MSPAEALRTLMDVELASFARSLQRRPSRSPRVFVEHLVELERLHSLCEEQLPAIERLAGSVPATALPTKKHR
jgi:hypothetical protein